MSGKDGLAAPSNWRLAEMKKHCCHCNGMKDVPVLERESLVYQETLAGASISHMFTDD